MFSSTLLCRRSFFLSSSSYPLFVSLDDDGYDDDDVSIVESKKRKNQTEDGFSSRCHLWLEDFEGDVYERKPQVQNDDDDDDEKKNGAKDANVKGIWKR